MGCSSMLLIGIMLVLFSSCGVAVKVDMVVDCTTNFSMIYPNDFDPCNVSDIDVITQESVDYDKIDSAGDFLCGTEFRSVIWQANYTLKDECNTFTLENFTRVIAIEPLPPSFDQPNLNPNIHRTTMDSLDPIKEEKPTATAKCASNLVYVGMTDEPAVKVGCGVWTIRRIWSLHIVALKKSMACKAPTGGEWDDQVFVQTITLVDASPPDFFPIENTPGAYAKPRLGRPEPSVNLCNQPITPLPPPFFADPKCASVTHVNLVQHYNVAPTAVSNRVCGSHFFKNVWQASYSSPCSGSSGRESQLVTLLPVPPVVTQVPGPVDITTSESLSPDHLGYAEGASPCGHDVDVTFADEPPVKVGCGKWTITRVWTVALHFDDADCTLPEQYTATATQLITIRDVSAPHWISQPSAQVRVPFFVNYQTEKSIPSAEEVAHPDMIQLGLTSHPIKLRYQDSILVTPKTPSAYACMQGLAVMQRTWTVSDSCDNSDSVVQTVIIEHPPQLTQPVQHWDSTQQWYYLAPGVHQLPDLCAAGKQVDGQPKEFYLTDGTGTVNAGCDGEGAWSPVSCEELAEITQDFYTQDIQALPPFFPDDTFPPSVTIDTTASLDPDVNLELGKPAGASYCSTPFTISYHDAPPEQQGCGVWSIARTWKIQPHYADCGGAEATYPDALTQRRVQVITIHDVTAPEWVHVPPPEVQVPFFENYQASNPIPLAKEIAHADMLALGLVSDSVKVTFQDSALQVTSIDEAHCSQGLASFERIWTAADACGNSQSYVQHIILLHPPSSPAPTQPWRPADADLATADRDITGPNRLFAYAPGVEQLGDACYPGKKVVGSGAVFTGVWQTDHNCSAGQWTETACRLEEQDDAASGVAVHSWPPYFVSFPDDVTIFTNQSLNVEGAIGGSHCGVPFTLSHHDAAPVQQSCNVWTIERTWTIQPNYEGCGGVDAKYADALTTIRVQVITVVDASPPEFITKPSQDLFVEFLEDYGPIATGVPQVEDKATSPDVAALGLISYPITLEYNDVHVNFFPGDVSHAQGMAVVSRVWTTRDVCGNTADWLQTIRVRNPNSHGSVGPLGSVGNFTVFGTEEVHLQYTEFHGSVGSNSKVYLTSTQPSTVAPDIVPDQEYSIFLYSEKLLSHWNRLFIEKLNACTGLKALRCTQPEQYSCRATRMSTPTTTTVSYDTAGNMFLEGNGLLYNVFNDVDIDDWRYAQPKVSPPPPPKQIIRAEGFIIINIVYSSLDASKSMLRETVFEQRFPAGDPFVLYNLKNIPEQPVQNMVFNGTKLSGSLLSQDAWNQIVFDHSLVTGQVLAVNKKVTSKNSTFLGQLFVPNFQVTAVV